jgi:hypothetical protein
MYMVRAATSSPFARDVGVPSRAADQSLEPVARIQSVDALHECCPLVRGRGLDGLDLEPAARVGQRWCLVALAAAEHAFVDVEGCESAVAQPALVLGGLTVGKRLQQEHVDPEIAIAGEDVVD